MRANSKWNGLPFDRGFDRILPAWRFYRINAEDLKKQMTGVNRDCNHPELSGILAEDLLPPICPVDIGDVLCSKPDDPEQAETAARRLRKAN